MNQISRQDDNNKLESGMDDCLEVVAVARSQGCGRDDDDDAPKQTKTDSKCKAINTVSAVSMAQKKKKNCQPEPQAKAMGKNSKSEPIAVDSFRALGFGHHQKLPKQAVQQFFLLMVVVVVVVVVVVLWLWWLRPCVTRQKNAQTLHPRGSHLANVGWNKNSGSGILVVVMGQLANALAKMGKTRGGLSCTTNDEAAILALAVAAKLVQSYESKSAADPSNMPHRWRQQLRFQCIVYLVAYRTLVE